MIMQHAGEQRVHAAEYQTEQQINEKTGECHRAFALALFGYE